MINQSTNIYQLLQELTKDVGSYYLKQKNLISSEENGHIIYSHFKEIRQSITPILLKQHLQKDLTLAISIKDKNILYVEYRGKDGFAFGTLLSRLVDKDKIDIYIIEYTLEKLSIYLRPKVEIDLDSYRDYLDSSLESKLSKEWKFYPLKNISNLGNLIVLPREFIESPWSF